MTSHGKAESTVDKVSIRLAIYSRGDIETPALKKRSAERHFHDVLLATRPKMMRDVSDALVGSSLDDDKRRIGLDIDSGLSVFPQSTKGKFNSRERRAKKSFLKPPQLCETTCQSETVTGDIFFPFRRREI